jgi:cytochrome c oxidase assembly factor 3
MSPGLIRARKIFLVPNTLTGIGLGLFTVAVWAYSINAVKQENFDDIDEEVRQLNATHTQSKPRSPVFVEVDRELTATSQPSGPMRAASIQHQEEETRKQTLHRGLLPSLLASRLLDPDSKTLVWGAPPIDSLGRLKDSRS